jgi:WhiB family redox-sensing transcriptional regulator
MNIFLPEDYPDFEEFGAPPCAESFPDAFFTEDKSESAIVKNGKTVLKTWARYDYEKEAKSLCAECPYKARCLEYAVNNPDLLGIWGGMTERQRRTVRRSRQMEPTNRGRPKVQ